MNVCERLQKSCKKAMLDEVYTIPKPDLVDCYSNGAHTDMNLHTFQNK